MLSPKQYAETVDRPYTTVVTWLQRGQVPGAVKHGTPTGHYWEIPEGTTPPELKPGPRPGTKKAAAKAAGSAKKSSKKAAK